MRMKYISCFVLLYLVTIIVQAAELRIENGYVPEAPPVAPVMAGYLTLVNTTNQPITITASRSDEFKRVEIHNMMMHDGMMHMEKQDRLTIPAHAKVSLEPGGYHLMLINPRRAFRAGEKIKITFVLSSGKQQTVILPVKKTAAPE